MPASMALIATWVRALPSKGRMTSASTFLSMSVCTWLICWLTSLLPSTACNVTSEYLPAWSLAFVVIAPIQPWSAAGAEKPMVTALPGVSLPLAPPLATLELWDAAADDVLLLVHAARAAPVPSAPAPKSRPRRPMARVGVDGKEDGEAGMVDLLSWVVWAGREPRLRRGGARWSVSG